LPRKKPEIRKQELIQIAMMQFIKNGYEKTSIRSIVGEANGDIGMFYHHFASKDQIFEAVLQQYNAGYVEKCQAIIAAHNETAFREFLDAVLTGLENALSEYGRLNSPIGNRQMLLLLHHDTLLKLVPIFAEVIQYRSQRREINPPLNDSRMTSEFLIFGISAVLHENNGQNMEEKKRAINLLAYRLLEVQAYSQSV
jgi:AcrR family transcriptional regulator